MTNDIPVITEAPKEGEHLDPRAKKKGAAKLARIPVKVVHDGPPLPKPAWIRVRVGGAGSQFSDVRAALRASGLATVCEEASCPNIGECYGRGTASFIIMGDKCTRRCPFCDVGHGKPEPLDATEPQRLAQAVARMKLQYVVITSVDRDDLKDGGAGHFAACIQEIRNTSPATRIEILTPDFRGRVLRALEALEAALPDVMNHNLETVPRLYRAARPGADYEGSLQLLAECGRRWPQIPTKSGLMLGLGETDEEIIAVMRDLRAVGVQMLTIGQYLAPSSAHLPVRRYATPEEFAALERTAREMGFTSAAIAPLVRSSYHADLQAQAAQQARGK